MLLTDLAEVTSDKLDGLGIEVPPSLAAATIGLWRKSGKAKWHWVDERSRCQHLPSNSYGRSQREVEPDQEIPALGFAIDRSSMCSGCRDGIALSAPAEAFIAVAAELLRAQDWLQRGRDAARAGTWTWIAFARWKARAPLTGKSWDTTLAQVRGKGWAATALTLRGLIANLHSDAAEVTRACIGSIAENPAQVSQVERAIRMVETDTAVATESDQVLRISGCPGEDNYPYGRAQRYSQDSPWVIVVTMWRIHHHSPVILEALCTWFDQEFPHVHDIHAISCTEHSPPYEPDECLHSWALRSAQAHRRRVVGQWLSRLDLALDGISSTDQDPALNCTHLVAVPFWPPTSDGMEPVAYLSQFDVVAGPFARRPEYFQTPSVAVLRVPEWAAAHVEQLHRPLRVVAIADEAVQAVQLARAEGVTIVAGEFRRRRKPSQRVAQCRAEMDGADYPYLEYRQYRRPLTPGAHPPPLYLGQQDPEAAWTYWGVQRALTRGREFVYGVDDLELLRLAWTGNRWRPAVTLTVELQTECEYHRDPEPHMCDVAGHILAISPDGSLEFTPDELAEPVTIPAAYVAGLTFR